MDIINDYMRHLDQCIKKDCSFIEPDDLQLMILKRSYHQNKHFLSELIIRLENICREIQEIDLSHRIKNLFYFCISKMICHPIYNGQKGLDICHKFLDTYQMVAENYTTNERLFYYYHEKMQNPDVVEEISVVGLQKRIGALSYQLTSEEEALLYMVDF
jgi:hypothetical protein